MAASAAQSSALVPILMSRLGALEKQPQAKQEGSSCRYHDRPMTSWSEDTCSQDGSQDRGQQR